MQDKDCIFCKIITGDIPSHKVYEDEDMLAFLDILPVNPGHLLIIPKNHIDQFQDLNDEVYKNIMAQAQKLSRKLKKVVKSPRVGVMLTGFEVPHTHVHVIPLWDDNDVISKRHLAVLEAEPTKLRDIINKIHPKPENDALAKMAEQLRA